MSTRRQFLLSGLGFGALVSSVHQADPVSTQPSAELITRAHQMANLGGKVVQKLYLHPDGRAVPASEVPPNCRYICLGWVDENGLFFEQLSDYGKKHA